MFDSLKRYVYDRRLGLLDATLTMGTTYAATAYMRARLEDMKENVVRQKMAKERSAPHFRSSCAHFSTRKGMADDSGAGVNIQSAATLSGDSRRCLLYNHGPHTHPRHSDS